MEPRNIPLLIPKPQSIVLNKGELHLNNIVITFEQMPPSLAFRIYGHLTRTFTQKGIDLFVDISTLEGYKLQKLRPCCQMGLNLALNPKLKVAEDGYSIVVDSFGVCLTGKSEAGLLSAVQTFFQLMQWAGRSNNNKIPYLKLSDAPHFSYRGLHLDVSRHFFPVEFILQYLEWMATLKLNKFHWHLTDDQGWRLESKKFPLLTEIGSQRIEADGSAYGGFYSHDDIRQVIKYATELGIEVIPEIDIPGHCLAAIAAYPHLSCEGKQLPVWNQWGVSDDILCAGKAETLAFLKELFTEVAGLFPGKYIHLGGDEAPKTRWKACPACQARMKQLNLKDEEALQGWLIRELTTELQNLGKEVIGWDEILDAGIDAQPVIMSWRGDGKAGAQKASASGNRFILCPNHYTYFDWKQSDKPGEQGAFGVTTSEKVYSLNLNDYTFDKPELLIGGQGNVWTEYMHNADDVYYMLCPRLYVLSEILWADPAQKDWTEFQTRKDYWKVVKPAIAGVEEETHSSIKSVCQLFSNNPQPIKKG